MTCAHKVVCNIFLIYTQPGQILSSNNSSLVRYCPPSSRFKKVSGQLESKALPRQCGT